MDSDYYTANTNENTSEMCLYVLLIFSGLCLGLVFLRYQVLVDLQISRFELSTEDSLWSSDKIPPLILDILIILIQPYPFLNGNQFNTQRLHVRH